MRHSNLLSVLLAGVLVCLVTIPTQAQDAGFEFLDVNISIFGSRSGDSTNVEIGFPGFGTQNGLSRNEQRTFLSSNVEFVITDAENNRLSDDTIFVFTDFISHARYEFTVPEVQAETHITLTATTGRDKNGLQYRGRDVDTFSPARSTSSDDGTDGFQEFIDIFIGTDTATTATVSSVSWAIKKFLIDPNDPNAFNYNFFTLPISSDAYIAKFTHSPNENLHFAAEFTESNLFAKDNYGNPNTNTTAKLTVEWTW